MSCYGNVFGITCACNSMFSFLRSTNIFPSINIFYLVNIYGVMFGIFLYATDISLHRLTVMLHRLTVSYFLTHFIMESDHHMLQNLINVEVDQVELFQGSVDIFIPCR